MAANATGAVFNYYHRFAALQTLGYLSDFMQREPLDDNTIASILHSTVTNIDEQHPNITHLALKTLGMVLPSCRKNFEVKEQRELIMNGIMRAISSNDEDSIELGMQAIAEVPTIGYQHLLPYINPIGIVTI